MITNCFIIPPDPQVWRCFSLVNITRCDKREKSGKAFYIIHAVDDKGYTGSFVCSLSYGEKLLAADGEKLHLGRNRVNGKSFLYIK